MTGQPLPEGWERGRPIAAEEYDVEPPVGEPGRYGLIGYKEGVDPVHCLYSVPAGTLPGHIVRWFEVGSAGGSGQVPVVAEIADRIAAILPCVVHFADPAGLKLRFERQITPEELDAIEALFPEEAYFDLGLERYLSEWDGESSLLAPVLEEDGIHLWWDH